MSKRRRSSSKTEAPVALPTSSEGSATTQPTGDQAPQDAAAECANAATTSQKEIAEKEVIGAIIVSLRADAKEEAAAARDNLIRRYLGQKVSQHKVSETYNILIVHDEGRMVQSDADYIYSAASAFGNKKPLLLVLYSTGGYIGSAYLIGKLCREYSNGRLVVVVPRQAKSAAALICCAADEIHMGSLSELGPIDPQINQLPALGLKNAVEHIADLVRQHPQASEMFAKYLHLSLQPISLGYYERVAESAAHYAERLLKTHAESLKEQPTKIAKTLVYSYKDHGFVIDKAEAMEIFGDNIVKTNTAEYALGNGVYQSLNVVSRMADVMDHYFYLIGSCTSQLHFVKRQK